MSRDLDINEPSIGQVLNEELIIERHIDAGGSHSGDKRVEILLEIAAGGGTIVAVDLVAAVFGELDVAARHDVAAGDIDVKRRSGLYNLWKPYS